MSNNVLFAAFVSIMVENINANGKCNDAQVCANIASHINMIPTNIYWADTLYEFISEYGEDVDETYMGRDEEGEKIYHTYNPETNWHDRVRKELVKLGYYKNVNLIPA